MTYVRDLLKNKQIKEVYTISPKTSLIDAALILGEKNVGALVVTQNNNPIGIISERDLVRKAREGGKYLDTHNVEDIMIQNVAIALTSDSVSYVSSIMTQNRIRHMPVIENQKMVGIISIGDVVHAQITDAKYEIRLLQDYIQGKYPG